MAHPAAADELDAAFCLLAGATPGEFAVEPLGREEVVAVFAPDGVPPTAYVTVADLCQHRTVAPRRGDG